MGEEVGLTGAEVDSIGSAVGGRVGPGVGSLEGFGVGSTGVITCAGGGRVSGTVHLSALILPLMISVLGSSHEVFR